MAGAFLKRQARRVVGPALALSSRTLHGFTHICLCAVLLFSSFLPLAPETKPHARRSIEFKSEEEIDAALQRAAREALGGREGAVLLMDPQTGRLRGVVNQRLSYEEAFPPGSAIKPFTMLAALRAGAVDEETRMLCQERYRRADFEIHCSHPKQKPPFEPVQALAYSCNYYFSKLGERLNITTFNSALTSFGFGARTERANEREASGMLPRGAWRISIALGDDQQLRVTPVQLLTAYAALFNGGHLYVPQQGRAERFQPQERARLEIAPEHRALLLKGMRGAVAYGTAVRAGLGALPPYVFGKTGTSTPDDDFRTTHGWFIGFAAGPDEHQEASPDALGLAVLVFLRRAQGAECAQLSRPIFEEYARLSRDDNRRAQDESDALDQATVNDESSSTDSDGQRIRVRLSREDSTRSLSLEDYVFGVMAAEGSVEDEPEALKALAVAVRTYALANLGRHARDGYDLCSSTHCQRYINVGNEGARAEFYDLLHRAVEETTGEVLLDQSGRIADAYFSADCGGRTANIQTLWGVPAPAYLRGGQDEYCLSAPPRPWTNTIPVAQLIRALRADTRTDVGARLNNVRVIKRDAGGRAEMIELEGEQMRRLRGWDFKIIVGRTLGWNMLKSTRFEVARVGSSFIFRGRGFGHGLGLCQTGAHVMARRGVPYRQILKQYFPGTSIGQDSARARRAGAPTRASVPAETSARTERWNADVMLQSSASSHLVVAAPFGSRSSHRLTISGEHFRASYPSRFERREVENALRILEGARADLAGRLSKASLKTGALPFVELYIHETTGDFVGATGQPPWVAAATNSRRIELQPLDVLRRRGIFATTLRHEYTHVLIEQLGHGRAPRWLAEGLAAAVAGEGAMLTRFKPKNRWPLDELERKLERPASASEMRSLYAAAYVEVSALIQKEGEANVWRRVARS
ncbi:MAG TPA: SpoIID/LytB domain-containing protein [Pyrinomonadaceae bacterium]